MPVDTTCVSDVAFVILDRQTGERRAWSARDQVIKLEVVYAKLDWSDVIEEPGKVLKCFTGRAGWCVDELSCVWHTPIIDYV